MKIGLQSAATNPAQSLKLQVIDIEHVLVLCLSRVFVQV